MKIKCAGDKAPWSSAFLQIIIIIIIIMFDSALYCAISKRYAFTILFEAPSFIHTYIYIYIHTHTHTHTHTYTHEGA